MQPREELYLDVVINDYRTGFLSAFRRYADGCLTIGADDLKQYNLKAPESAVHSGGGLCLEKMPGVSYRYDAPTQTIYLTVTDDARIPLAFSVRGPKPGSVVPNQEHNLSAIFNYALTANFGGDNLGTLPNYQGVGASVDGHLFSDYGNFDQSLALRSAVVDSGPNFLRLDSLWSYNDAGQLTTYAAGDIVSGSLGWTRAMRMGGVQIRRDFTLQPDLVTQPIPQLAGSAAVPSTVEVYANQSRAFSQEVTGGPFTISNLPVMSGPTTMQLVIRDAAGRETATEYSYYSSPLLVAPGLFDYSIESGFARTFYGLLSDSYDERPIASGSFRYGVTPHITLEGHAEGGAGLINGGAGLNFSLWRYGVASLAASGSDKGGGAGAQVSGSIETSLWGVKLSALSMRSLGDYQDLVSVTAPKLLLTPTSGPITAAQSGAPYKRQDQFSASFPLPFDKGSISLSYTDSEDFSGDAYKIGSASYTRPFFWSNSTFSLTAFDNFESKSSYGVYAGVTFSWDRISAGALTQGSANSVAAGGFVSQAMGLDPGSYGYMVRAQEGQVSTNSAAVSYRASAMTLQAGVQQSGNTSQVGAQADGSVAILNGIYFANRIDNSFAVVDTGVPGMQVLYENHPAGETDSDGKLLIPNMRARESNAISIDPASIPVQADIDGLEQKVVPAQRGGMSVHFKGNAQPASAIAVFKDEKGAVIPTSSEVWVNGAPTSSVIGYDGEAYLTNLAPSNTALVKRPDGTSCNASFAFSPQQGAQARIDDVVCEPSETAAKSADAANAETIKVKR
ncbi:MAG: fimbria/pilus outer membrane usher protein [Rhodomicrobium sp.]